MAILRASLGVLLHVYDSKSKASSASAGRLMIDDTRYHGLDTMKVDFRDKGHGSRQLASPP